jgi:hypothetical protein
MLLHIMVCRNIQLNGIQDKLAAIFCHQVAAWFPDIFSNFYVVKSYKIVNNSGTAEAREKISTDLESLEI